MFGEPYFVSALPFCQFSLVSDYLLKLSSQEPLVLSHLCLHVVDLHDRARLYLVHINRQELTSAVLHVLV